MPNFTEEFADDSNYVSGSSTGLTQTEISQGVLRLDYDEANSKYYESGNAIVMRNLNEVSGDIGSITFTPEGVELYWNTGSIIENYSGSAYHNNQWYETSPSGRYPYDNQVGYNYWTYDQLTTNLSLSKTEGTHEVDGYGSKTFRKFHEYNYFKRGSNSFTLNIDVLPDYNMEKELVSSGYGLPHWHKPPAYSSSSIWDLTYSRTTGRDNSASGALKLFASHSSRLTAQRHEMQLGSGDWAPTAIKDLAAIKLWVNVPAGQSDVGISVYQVVSGDATNRVYRGGWTVNNGQGWNLYSLALNSDDNGGECIVLEFIRQTDLKDLEVHLHGAELEFGDDAPVAVTLTNNWSRNDGNNKHTHFKRKWVKHPFRDYSVIHRDHMYSETGNKFSVGTSWESVKTDYPHPCLDYTITEYEKHDFGIMCQSGSFYSGGYEVRLEDHVMMMDGVATREISDSYAFVRDYDYAKAHPTWYNKNEYKFDLVDGKNGGFRRAQEYRIWDDSLYGTSSMQFKNRMRPQYTVLGGGKEYAAIIEKNNHNYYVTLGEKHSSYTFAIQNNTNTWYKDGIAIGTEITADPDNYRPMHTRTTKATQTLSLFNSVKRYFFAMDSSDPLKSTRYDGTKDFTLTLNGTSSVVDSGAIMDGRQAVNIPAGSSNYAYYSQNTIGSNARTFGAWFNVTTTGQLVHWGQSKVKITMKSATQVDFEVTVLANGSSVTNTQTLTLDSSALGRWIYIGVDAHDVSGTGVVWNFYADNKTLNKTIGSDFDTGITQTSIDFLRSTAEGKVSWIFMMEDYRYTSLPTYNNNKNFWAVHKIRKWNAGKPHSSTSLSEYTYFEHDKRRAVGNGWMGIYHDVTGSFVLFGTNEDGSYFGKPSLFHAETISSTYKEYKLLDSAGVHRTVLADSLTATRVGTDLHVFGYVETATANEYELHYWKWSARGSASITGAKVVGTNDSATFKYSGTEKWHATPVAVSEVEDVTGVTAAGVAIGTAASTQKGFFIWWDGTNWKSQGSFANDTSDWLGCTVHGNKLYAVAASSRIYETSSEIAGEAKKNTKATAHFVEVNLSDKTVSLKNDGSQFRQNLDQDYGQEYKSWLAPGKPLVYMEKTHMFREDDFEAGSTGINDYTATNGATKALTTHDGKSVMKVTGNTKAALSLTWNDMLGSTTRTDNYVLIMRVKVSTGRFKIVDTSDTAIPVKEVGSHSDWQYVVVRKTGVEALDGAIKLECMKDSTEYFIEYLLIHDYFGSASRNHTNFRPRPIPAAVIPLMYPIQETSNDSYVRKSYLEALPLFFIPSEGGAYYIKNSSTGERLIINGDSQEIGAHTFDKFGIEYSNIYYPPKLQKLTLDNQATIKYYVSRNGRHFFEVASGSTHTFVSDDETDANADWYDSTTDASSSGYMRTRIEFLA